MQEESAGNARCRGSRPEEQTGYGLFGCRDLDGVTCDAHDATAGRPYAFAMDPQPSSGLGRERGYELRGFVQS